MQVRILHGTSRYFVGWDFIIGGCPKFSKKNGVLEDQLSLQNGHVLECILVCETPSRIQTWQVKV